MSLLNSSSGERAAVLNRKQLISNALHVPHWSDSIRQKRKVTSSRFAVINKTYVVIVIVHFFLTRLIQKPLKVQHRVKVIASFQNEEIAFKVIALYCITAQNFTRN